MYYFEEEVAAVTKAAGVRGVLGQTVIQFPVADAVTPGEALKRAEAFILKYKGDDLIVPAAMMGAPTVMVEKMPNGDDIVNAFQVMGK